MLYFLYGIPHQCPSLLWFPYILDDQIAPMGRIDAVLILNNYGYYMLQP